MVSFIEDHKADSLFANIPASILQDLFRLAFSSDTIMIDGKFYRQKSGLSMGNSLSPVAAIIYMNDVESKIRISTYDNLLFWKRYIDDIFFIIDTSDGFNSNRLLDLVNGVNPYIQFTVETPENDSIPFLDTYVTHENDMSFSLKLYVKDIHSNHIMPWNSHVPYNQKVSVIKTEKLRALRYSTTEKNRKESLKMIANRFLANGYPRRLVQSILYSQRKNNRRNQQSKKIFVKLPYISDSCNTRFRHTLKHLDKNIQISWINEKPLWRRVKPKNSINCDHRCVCGSKNLCFKKNVVYRIDCMYCQNFYVGETHRTLFSRIKEHLKLSSSNVFRHLKTDHSVSSPCFTDISVSVLSSGFVDSTHRKKMETNSIRQLRPAINKQFT